MRANIQLITAAVLAIGGLVLLFCGVYITPQGEIHESLLVGFGEVVKQKKKGENPVIMK